MNKIEERDMRKYIELNKKDNFITELHEELIRERQITNEKIKEIERLNNIIKRLEEDLREMYLTFGEFSEEYTEKKIKELKGDGSNE